MGKKVNCRSLLRVLEGSRAKLKEQNSSRLTGSKKGLGVTKWKGLGKVGEEEGRRGLGVLWLVHIM